MRIFFIYHKPSIKGAYLFQAHLRRGRHSFEWGRGLFNLEKMMVSVLHKELEEAHKNKKVGGHVAKDQNQIRTSNC